ncbi:MAG TPA: tetratricopeptide repeat protein [Syntrophobacteria bacterium]|nr:tetratricopeptide repeat protein [Syntrophobacteria bacterium]
MARRLLCCWVVVALLIFGSRQARAQENPDELWEFAGQLYEQGDFYRAVGEYQRFRFLFPDDPRAGEAELRIGRCYRLGGDFDKAFSLFLALSQGEPRRPEARAALVEMIAMLEAQRRYREAAYWGERFVALYPDDPEREAVLVRLAWLYVDTGDSHQAVATLAKIPPGSSRYDTARSLIQVLEERPYQAPKSPEVAGTLAAVLPGAGHLYVGRPAQAATSFLLNGLFILGAVAAFTHDSPVLGGILLFFELGWYQGGIRSAAAAAREVNAEEERRYRQELRRDYRLSFGIFPGRDQVLFAVRLDL